MKKINILLVLWSCALTCASQSEEPPHAEITNGILEAQLYLPDAEKGYYRAVRFDWSGVISSLTYKGHNYYGQWFDDYFPTKNFAMMGPAEEFNPVNYDEAKPGENFVKIGVGVLTKTSDSLYDKHVLYPSVDLGEWKIKKGTDNIQFVHELNSENTSYLYTKTVTLVEGKPELVIDHIVKNTGKQTIETSVLNHNFFMIDSQTTGPGFEVTMPVDVTGTGKGLPDIFDLQGNKIIFKRDLVKGESVFCESVEGLNQSFTEYDIKLENTTVGAGARIRSDRPVSRMHFWANSRTICPEPYVDIKVEPGKEFTWRYNYEFFISDISKQ